MRHFGGKPAGPVVLSLNVQARLAAPARVQGQFEVLVRHLFDRMLNNDAFGDDAATRATQLAYAIGLPGVLVALFLFAAYHQPMPQVRAAWAQAADHLFYVTYAFVVMGLAVVFQWELLFPDLLDMYVFASLPLRGTRLLLGRALALAIFLGLTLAGTSALGCVFFPAVADLRCGFAWHVVAHTLAVALSGFAAVVFFVALQGLLVLTPGRALRNGLGAVAKALSVVALLTTLFLFPLAAHFLPVLLGSGTAVARYIPPFWFLGVYECVLWGAAAPPVFHELARTGVIVTGLTAGVSVLVYAPAHASRMRSLVEGSGVQTKGSQRVRRALETMLHGMLVRTPGERAIFHYAAQTLLRLPRLQLYLAMYAGLGLALLLSGLLVFRVNGGHVRLAVTESGVRLAVPVLAFWTVAGLRTALRSPLGRKGSWIFHVIRTNSRAEELRGAELLVRWSSGLVTIAAVALLHGLALGAMRGTLPFVGQVVVAAGLCAVLTDVLFLTVRSIPFTAVQPAMTRELPMTLVRYLVVFPALALYVADRGPWIEASYGHLLIVAVAFAGVHVGLRRLRGELLGREEPREELLFTGLGLRD